LQAADHDTIALVGSVAGGVGGLDGNGVAAFADGDFTAEEVVAAGQASDEGGLAVDRDRCGFVGGAFDEGHTRSPPLRQLIHVIELRVGRTAVDALADAVPGGVPDCTRTRGFVTLGYASAGLSKLSNLPGPGFEDAGAIVGNDGVGQLRGFVVGEGVVADGRGGGALLLGPPKDAAGRIILVSELTEGHATRAGGMDFFEAVVVGRARDRVVIEAGDDGSAGRILNGIDLGREVARVVLVAELAEIVGLGGQPPERIILVADIGSVRISAVDFGAALLGELVEEVRLAMVGHMGSEGCKFQITPLISDLSYN